MPMAERVTAKLLTRRSCEFLAATLIALGCPLAHGAPARAASPVDLSQSCVEGNCDQAFSNLVPGRSYYLPAGVWRFTKALTIPSDVTLTGDGTGLAGTDLVYAGPSTGGAAVVAGAPGRDWTDGHLAAVEIETEQLHQLRLRGDVASAIQPIDQAAVGLEIINPTSSSTVDNVNVWKFGKNSVLVENHAAAPGLGSFQFSDFFIGTSPRPLEIEGSSASLLVRFGGIDLGPLSRFGMQVSGDRSGATSVVESVKVEGDYDVPGFIVEGTTPVVFVGSTRYFNQSLYVSRPLNGAPAFLSRDSASVGSSTIQCLACTALGEQTALAITDQSLVVPTSKWGIDLHLLTHANAISAARILRTPETSLARPHDFVDLSTNCFEHNCDGALTSLKFGGRYYLPEGVWTFTRPFTLPSGVTLFGDGPQPGALGGSELRYVGSSLPNDAAVRFGPGGDMSAARLFALRISTRKLLGAGFGLRARDATNASTIEDIAVQGFPDGQILVDTTPPNAGSGPNFFRITRFSIEGGVHPLRVEGGRQTVLIQQGLIQLDPTSVDGLSLNGGEQLAATRIVEQVRTKSRRDVPGFRVRGPAVTAFVDTMSRVERAGNSPGISYTARVPRQATECLTCAVHGHRTALKMAGFRDTASHGGGSFDYLNEDSALVRSVAPVNLDLPIVTGISSVSGSVTSATGIWTNDPVTYAYEWVRCKRPDIPSNPATRCSRISDAAGSAYQVTTADSGFYLRVEISASNGRGVGTAVSLPILVSN
jgi:hypothetical protein